MQHSHSTSLEGSDWRLGYKKIYDGSASGTIAEAKKMTEWVDAVVPGNVRADMMAAGRVPDLYVGQNNERATWLNDCVWWYEKRFPRPQPKSRRCFIELRGIDYLSEVYLNDTRLGTNEGMFTRHLYEISSILRDKNVLNVRIIGSSFLPKPNLSALQRLWGKIGARLQNGEEVFPERMETLKCQMSFGWDFAPDMRTMGIWDEVTLIQSGNMFLEDVDVRSSMLDELENAHLQLKLDLNSTMAGQLKIAVQLRPANFEGPTQNFSFNAYATKGTEIVERSIVLNKPRLWNPWDRGDPNLYELTIKLINEHGQSDSVSGLIGFRDIQMQRNPKTPRRNLNWTFVVNGQREFIRGANWVPMDSLMGRPREEDYSKLIRMAREANINMLRVWGGGLREKRYFYELCSREGILVWQELPFACVFLGRLPSSKQFLDKTEKEIGSIIKAVANYPCVALYCGGNEFSPTRNSKLLSKIEETVKGIDPLRLFLPASPAHGDNHNWYIWHGYGNIKDYRKDNCQFASEFGLQAAPSVESIKRFLDKQERWPPGTAWQYHNADLDKLERYTGPIEDFNSLEQFVEMSQKKQAFALQTAIEHYRRRKYECSGSMFWQLNEPWPSICWSIIDYFKVPKYAYYKLKEIYNPVLISLKFDLRRYTAGEEVPIEVWIVNDLLDELEDCTLGIYLDNNGKPLMDVRFDLGTVPPDSSATYLQFGLKLSNRREWPLHATLHSGGELLSTNSYDLTMWDPGEATPGNRIYDRLTKLVMS